MSCQEDLNDNRGSSAGALVIYDELCTLNVCVTEGEDQGAAWYVFVLLLMELNTD